MKNRWMALVSSADSRGLRSAAEIAGTTDLTEAVTMPEVLAAFVGVESTVLRRAAFLS